MGGGFGDPQRSPHLSLRDSTNGTEPVRLQLRNLQSAAGHLIVVAIDGQVRRDVRAVTLSCDANEIATATITFVIDELDVDVLAEPQLEASCSSAD